jgi:hypothetical protein
VSGLCRFRCREGPRVVRNQIVNLFLSNPRRSFIITISLSPGSAATRLALQSKWKF